MAIGVALVGSGIFAKEQHLPAIKASTHLILKAIYSRSLKSASALVNIADNNEQDSVDIYADDAGDGRSYEDLLRRGDIEAVIIALPIMAQPEYVEAALRAGKHVLSEKPIAGDIKSAKRLIEIYTSLTSSKDTSSKSKEARRITWSIAENYRFMPSFLFAAEQVKQLGRVLGFSVYGYGLAKKKWKYLGTEWRKVPGHQGGFLLDGGVHTVAAARLLLGGGSGEGDNGGVIEGSGSASKRGKITSLSAYTIQLQPHLPPIDTVNSIWRLDSGVSGTVAMSFGTTLEGREFTIACERGSVVVRKGVVVVRKFELKAKSEEKSSQADITEEEEEEEEFSFDKCTVIEHDFSSEGPCVLEEVAAWAEILASGNGEGEGREMDRRFDPREALADLELVEGMVRSGEKHGEGVGLVFQ